MLTPSRSRPTVFGSTWTSPQAHLWEKPRSAIRRSTASRRAAGPISFFPRRSFSADTSSIDSAKSFFSRRFSSYSAFSFVASDTLIPLYFAFHR